MSRTMLEILNMLPEDRKEKYRVDNDDRKMQEVVIDGIKFTDYGAFSFIREKSYFDEPTRGADGTIQDLNNYATFVTPHLTINFSLLSIESYRDLMRLIYSKNEFLVTCYDVVQNKKVTERMYFTTEEMPKLFALAKEYGGDKWIELLGVQDYTVEMVGTNVSVDTVTVNYYLNHPKGTGQTTPIYSETVDFGLDFIIGLNSGIEGFEVEGYTFASQWHLNEPTGTIFPNGSAYTISYVDTETMSINFYADWREQGYIMSLNYGLGDTVYDSEHNPIDKLFIQAGETVADAIDRANKYYFNAQGESVKLTSLPASPPIKVYDDVTGEEVTPYINEGWYFTSTIGTGSTKITNSTELDISSNFTIHQVFKLVSFLVTTIVDGFVYTQSTMPYGSKFDVEPYKYGYVFKGWYLDEDFTQTFNGTIPSHNIILYAKFEEE